MQTHPHRRYHFVRHDHHQRAQMSSESGSNLHRVSNPNRDGRDVATHSAGTPARGFGFTVKRTTHKSIVHNINQNTEWLNGLFITCIHARLAR